MMALKTLRNVAATPFVLVTDHSREYFSVVTMYKKSVRRSRKFAGSVQRLIGIGIETLSDLIAGYKSSKLLPLTILVKCTSQRTI